MQITEADRQAAIAELIRRGYVWKTTVTLTSRKGRKLFQAAWWG